MGRSWTLIFRIKWILLLVDSALCVYVIRTPGINRKSVQSLLRALKHAWFWVFGEVLWKRFGSWTWKNAISPQTTGTGWCSYDGIPVGEYFADVVVENLVLVELESRMQLIDKDEARLLDYLKATKCEVSPLLNFGTKPEIKRKAFDNYR